MWRVFGFKFKSDDKVKILNCHVCHVRNSKKSDEDYKNLIASQKKQI